MNDEMHADSLYAYKNGVSTLYKFSSYPSKDAERRGWIDALLEKGELYFALADEFNDPFEVSPRLVFLHESADLQRSALEQDIRRQLNDGGCSLNEIEQRVRDFLSRDWSAVLAEVQAKQRRKFRDEFPIVCFSSSIQSVLMWSYYASGHTGLAVHFDATAAPWGLAQKVQYSTDYPVVPVPLSHLEPSRVAAACLLTKSKDWEHESEYRLINYPMAAPDGSKTRMLDPVLRWKSERVALVDPAAIIGVTFGAKMKPDERRSIAKICAARKLPMYETALHESAFRVESKPVRG